jgi:hypothetical protein
LLRLPLELFPVREAFEGGTFEPPLLWFLDIAIVSYFDSVIVLKSCGLPDAYRAVVAEILFKCCAFLLGEAVERHLHPELVVARRPTREKIFRFWLRGRGQSELYGAQYIRLTVIVRTNKDKHLRHLELEVPDAPIVVNAQSAQLHLCSSARASESARL